MYKLIKRFFDFIVALALLILLSPLLLIISIAIRLDSPGPVFVKLTRIGQNAHPFSALKFRTMLIHANDTSHQIYIEKLITGKFGPEKGAATLKLRNDPRVTIVGLFLKRYSLDELPQVVNILVGDMSLVGPRAAIPFEVEHYEEWQLERLKIKPGLTGLWQVYGQGTEVDFNQMVKMDIDYLNRQSFLLDIKILLKTVLVTLSGTGT